MTLDEFAADIIERIRAGANAVQEGSFREESFVDFALELLTEHGDLLSPEPIYLREAKFGIRMNAYDVVFGDRGSDPAEGDVTQLTLIAGHFVDDVTDRTLTDDAVNDLWKGLDGLVASVVRSRAALEEATGELQVIHLAAAGMTAASAFRALAVTNQRLGDRPSVEWRVVEGITVRHEIVGLEQLHQIAEEVRGKELVVDLDKDFGSCLPYLKFTEAGYDSFLTVFPGDLLAKLYLRYGSRLFERNVRVYLQSKTAVNRGILETLASEPEMFFAYNNGLSGIASAVDTVVLDGTHAIRRLIGLQIVNGAQTTASLAEAQARGDDLSRVAVQVKLSIVSDADMLDESAQRISRFANTQNRIRWSDLRSNDRYHQDLAALAKTMWPPPPEKGAASTLWYYERSRGGYLDEKFRQTAGKKRDEWIAIHPSDQVITKIDAAKYLMAWRCQPHVVSLGAEKNFDRLGAILSASAPPVDEQYFRRLVAKAIVWRECDQQVKAMRLGGYKSAVVPYTIAWLQLSSGGHFDLQVVWRNQGLSDDCRSILKKMANAVVKHLNSTPRNVKNVLEWAKKERCWETLAAKTYPLGKLPELKPKKVDIEPGPHGPIVDLPMDAETWGRLARWGAGNGVLSDWETKFVLSISVDFLKRGRSLSQKQLAVAEKLWRKAIQNGFEARAESGG
jgi:hypothetical protein